MKTTSSGLSLIEMIVYIAILSGIAILTISSMLSLGRSYNSLMVTKRVNTTAAVTLDRFVREIRAAISVNTASSSLGVHPGVLVLNTVDENELPTSVSFYLDGGAVKVVEGGIAAGSLTQRGALITNLIFTRVSNNQSETVKIDMEVTGARGAVTKVVPFHLSAVLRGGY